MFQKHSKHAETFAEKRCFIPIRNFGKKKRRNKFYLNSYSTSQRCQSKNALGSRATGSNPGSKSHLFSLKSSFIISFLVFLSIFSEANLNLFCQKEHDIERAPKLFFYWKKYFLVIGVNKLL